VNLKVEAKVEDQYSGSEQYYGGLTIVEFVSTNNFRTLPTVNCSQLKLQPDKRISINNYNHHPNLGSVQIYTGEYHSGIFWQFLVRALYSKIFM